MPQQFFGIFAPYLLVSLVKTGSDSFAIKGVLYGIS